MTVPRLVPTCVGILVDNDIVHAASCDRPKAAEVPADSATGGLSDACLRVSLALWEVEREEIPA